jgi:hypothetical protein
MEMDKIVKKPVRGKHLKDNILREKKDLLK